MPSPSTAADDRLVASVAARVDAELRRRGAALREQGRSLADLGEADSIAERMLATLPEASPWQALGPYYSTKGVARLLGGVSRQAIEERRRRRSILALRTNDDVWVYPAFQFDRANRLVPGLGAVLACFEPDGRDDWTVASLLVEPQPTLDGRSIIEALPLEQGSGAAIALARAVADRWRQ